MRIFLEIRINAHLDAKTTSQPTAGYDVPVVLIPKHALETSPGIDEETQRGKEIRVDCSVFSSG